MSASVLTKMQPVVYLAVRSLPLSLLQVSLQVLWQQTRGLEKPRAWFQGDQIRFDDLLICAFIDWLILIRLYAAGNKQKYHSGVFNYMNIPYKIKIRESQIFNSPPNVSPPRS